MKTISRITENADIWAPRLVSDGYHQISFSKFCSSSQPCRSPIRSGSRQQPSLDTAWDLPDQCRESNSKEGNYSQFSATPVMQTQCALSPACSTGQQWHFPLEEPLHFASRGQQFDACSIYILTLALQVSCCLQPPLTAWDIKLWSLAHSWCSLQNPFLSIPASNYPLHSGKCWPLCSVRVEQLQQRGNDHLRGVSYWEFEILSSLLSSRWVKSKSIRW